MSKSGARRLRWVAIHRGKFRLPHRRPGHDWTFSTFLPRRTPMRLQSFLITLAATGLCASLSGQAQTPPAANPLDAVPDNMPFDVPYGAPISLDRAASVIAAAV